MDSYLYAAYDADRPNNCQAGGRFFLGYAGWAKTDAEALEEAKLRYPEGGRIQVTRV